MIRTIPSLFERIFRRKAPNYLRFLPLPPADEALCMNCGRPHDDHHPHGACPHVDGSGFSINQHFRRQRPLTECDISALDQKVDLLEELSDETRKLSEDLREIGEA
jgi:hypothetical protein